MSAVTILAAGARANAGVGSAVDVSAHAVLRLDIYAVTSPRESVEPRVLIELEQAPASTGPWSPLWEKRLSQTRSFSERVKIGDFDKFVRAKWSDEASPVSTGPGRAHLNAPDASSYGFNLSITGEGKPDA
jgi:hypothetical protein